MSEKFSIGTLNPKQTKTKLNLEYAFWVNFCFRILDSGCHAVAVDDVTERDQYGSSNTPVFVYVFRRYCVFVSFHVDVHYRTCRIKLLPSE